MSSDKLSVSAAGETAEMETGLQARRHRLAGEHLQGCETMADAVLQAQLMVGRVRKDGRATDAIMRDPIIAMQYAYLAMDHLCRKVSCSA